MSGTNNTVSSTSAEKPTLGTSNVFGSPASTWTGGAALLAVIANAMASGLPTTRAGWINFGLTVIMGIGAIFSKG
jgi:hypothetical protein